MADEVLENLKMWTVDPLCVAAAKRIEADGVEIERLRALLGEAATYMQVCPPPTEAGDQLRSALQDRRHRVIAAATPSSYEQKADSNG